MRFCSSQLLQALGPGRSAIGFTVYSMRDHPTPPRNSASAPAGLDIEDVAVAAWSIAVMWCSLLALTARPDKVFVT